MADIRGKLFVTLIALMIAYAGLMDAFCVFAAMSGEWDAGPAAALAVAVWVPIPAALGIRAWWRWLRS